MLRIESTLPQARLPCCACFAPPLLLQCEVAKWWVVYCSNVISVVLDSGQNEYDSHNVLIGVKDPRSQEELELKGLDINKVGWCGMLQRTGSLL